MPMRLAPDRIATLVISRGTAGDVMRQKHTLEFVFLLMVIALSLIGFSSLLVGEHTKVTPYHYLHMLEGS
jgi:hypothetical protein